MDPEAYSKRAEAFSAELAREYYRHFAGLQEDFAMAVLYEHNDDLFTRAVVDELRALAARAPAGADERGRRLHALLRFAVEGHLGRATRVLEAELVQREAALSVEVAPSRRGRAVERIGFREAALAQAVEPDPERRERLDAARLAAVSDALTPLAREALEQRHALARELGWPSYRAMWEELLGIDLVALAGEAADLLAASEKRYADAVAPAVRRAVGVGLDGLRRADLPWLLRNAQADPHFPADRLLSSFRATLAALGIDLDRQPNVVLDLDRRPRKSPRAFCAPVRVPEEIYLVVPRVGGREDYVALLHEGGHAEHFAGVDATLPFELRQLGDHAVTEAFAFLFEGLAEEPAWLRRHLSVQDSDGALRQHARAQRLIFVRRHAAKLVYELELHGGQDGEADGLGRTNGLADELSGLYARRLSAAVRVDWPRETWLTDVDPGFYVANYLRAWTLEARLRRALTERFGAAWFERAAAGDYLRSLWRESQRWGAEELLDRVEPGARLDLRTLAEEL
jgi:hypothetical protein